MGTRAVYTFIDEYDQFNVYKHYDGYPTEEGALGAIKEAKDYAWEFPRFEASDFAAAFIAANKQKGGGDVYMTDGYTSHLDLEYRYEIGKKNNQLHVMIFKVEDIDDHGYPVYGLINEVTL